MQRRLLVLASTLVAGSCAGDSGGSAGSEARAERLAGLSDADPVAYERERETELRDPLVARLFTARIFDRVMEADAEIRRADLREDAPERERAKRARSRAWAELLRIGEPAAEFCIAEAATAGPRMTVALEAIARMDDV